MGCWIPRIAAAFLELCGPCAQHCDLPPGVDIRVDSNAVWHSQDMNVLHEQERKLAKKPRGWREYYLATQSDTGVASFWRWLDTFAGMPL